MPVPAVPPYKLSNTVGRGRWSRDVHSKTKDLRAKFTMTNPSITNDSNLEYYMRCPTPSSSNLSEAEEHVIAGIIIY